MGFSRQEYWSGLPFPPPGDLLNPGIKPKSPAAPALQADSLPLRHLGSPWILPRSLAQAFRKIPEILTSTLKNYQARLPLNFPRNLRHLCLVIHDLAGFTAHATVIL